RRLPDPGGLWYSGEGVLSRPDLLLVREHVVRDPEHREGRDPGGEAREPHQRQSNRECEDAADGRGERKRDVVADGRRSEEVGEAGHREPLLLTRYGYNPRGPRPKSDEADRPEREDARIADEHIEGDDDRDLDERVEE